MTVALELGGKRIDTFKSYHFNSHFLTPTDGWSFTLGDETIPDDVMALLIPGTNVKLYVNDLIQGSGLIDDIDFRCSRSGTEITVSGRDTIAPVCDACVDPQLRFAAGETLDVIVSTVLGDFGFASFATDTEPNVNAMTGQVRGTPTTKRGKPLKSYVAHQIKPYPNEGAFAFLSRLSQRFGLWIWASADGRTAIVGKPDFDQAPLYKLVNHRGADSIYNNILSSVARYDGTEQPSCIVATGFGSGGEYPVGQFSLMAVNPAVVADNSKMFAAYPNTRVITTDYFSPAYSNPHARPMFLHDDEAKTFDQLEAFLRRELALRMRRTLSYQAEVFDHTYAGIPWTVNTVVDVQDDACRVHEPMWIMGRTFTQDRQGGTRTELEMIRLGTLAF